MKITINRFSFNAGGYVIGGPENFVWSLLAAYYMQEGKVEPATKDQIVQAVLNYPDNRYSKEQIEQAVENLCGAGRNGPIHLAPLLEKDWDYTISPTKYFGLMIEMPNGERISTFPKPDVTLKTKDGKEISLSFLKRSKTFRLGLRAGKEGWGQEGGAWEKNGPAFRTGWWAEQCLRPTAYPEIPYEEAEIIAAIEADVRERGVCA